MTEPEMTPGQRILWRLFGWAIVIIGMLYVVGFLLNSCNARPA